MKIKQKLIFSYLAISLLGAIAGSLGIQNMSKIDAGFNRIAEQTIPVKNELDNLERSISDLAYCTIEFILLYNGRDEFARNSKPENKIISKLLETKIQEEFDEIKLDKKAYKKSLDKYESIINSYFPDEKDHLYEIKSSSQKILKISDDLVSFLKTDHSKLQVFQKQGELDYAREEFKETIQGVIEHERNELLVRKENLSSNLKIATEAIFYVSIFNILLAIAIGVFVAISISRPIEKLKNAAIAIGKGDLGVQIKLHSKDELGILAQAFNAMAEDLYQYISALKGAKEDNALLATALENVTDAIEITDTESRYLYVNPAFEAITGYTKQEVLGKTPALLRSGSHDPDLYQAMFDT
ncbi:MAG: HAMP domain-containing protein, partial [Thermosynechococcaceae cyanobacterium]